MWASGGRRRRAVGAPPRLLLAWAHPDARGEAVIDWDGAVAEAADLDAPEHRAHRVYSVALRTRDARASALPRSRWLPVREATRALPREQWPT